MSQRSRDVSEVDHSPGDSVNAKPEPLNTSSAKTSGEQNIQQQLTSYLARCRSTSMPENALPLTVPFLPP